MSSVDKRGSEGALRALELTGRASKEPGRASEGYGGPLGVVGRKVVLYRSLCRFSIIVQFTSDTDVVEL